MKEMNLFGEATKRGNTMISFESIPTLLQKKRYGANVDADLAERKEHVLDVNLRGLHGETIVYTEIDEIRNKMLFIEKLFQSVTIAQRVQDTESILIEGFYSATIEGAKTTVEKVKQSFNNPQNKSDKMVINSYKSLAYMKDKKITENTLFKAWCVLVDGVCENENVRGDKYRSGMVTVSDSFGNVVHTPAKQDAIQGYMDALFGYLHTADTGFTVSLVKAILAHFYLVYIHPMCDGNGRLARLLMLSYMNECGYSKVFNLSISRSIAENISGYYNSFIESEKVFELNGKTVIDITPFLVYMLDVFERSLMMYKVYNTSVLSDLEGAVVSKMKKVGIHAEITAAKCARLLKVSEDKATAVLDSLSEKNILEKRENVYRLL